MRNTIEEKNVNLWKLNEREDLLDVAVVRELALYVIENV